MESVPRCRIQPLNAAPVHKEGGYVLYWMTAARRLRWNFGLQRAVECSKEWNRPLLILEALRCDYPWANARLHRFILEGMRENALGLQGTPVFYYPFIEWNPGQGKGLLEAVSKRACAVVADWFPAFFIPNMIRAAASKIGVRLEAVDGNGLLPLEAAGGTFQTAHAFRRFLQKNLRPYLFEFPEPDPIGSGALPPFQGTMTEVASKWPSALEHLLSDDDTWWDGIPLDRSVSPGWCRGGEGEARRRLDTFVRSRLPRYAEGRPHPDEDAESGLSPYLHFGHLSAHEVFSRIADEEEWTIERLASASTGSRTGWWGMSENAEAFLDQLVTWRELGFNMCHHRDDYDRYGSLPDWARQTLAAHAPDPRPFLYEPEAFETAATHDPIWNAAQTQLATEGRMHNYLRMLWGKKILHWTRSPEEALAVMLELNNKYALDGRDPNSYTGIFWILGRYDRPWGPERPVFGKVRYMSSKNTARKLRMSDYLERYRP